MAHRNPRYCFLHAMRDAGASGISADGTFGTSTPKDYLIDDRAGSLMTFTAASATHYIQMDRGAAGLEALGRMLIPAGHNLDGITVRVRSATDAAITTSVTTLVDSVVVADGLIDEDFDTTSTQRYVRMDFPSDNFNPQIGEIVYTRTRTTTRGPAGGWIDMLRHNTLDFRKESGAIASLSLGSDARFIEYIYRLVNDSDDLDVFSELIAACGTSKPFYLDPVFDTEAAVWMKLEQDVQQSLDRAAPASPSSARPEITLSMLEHLA